MSYIDPKTGEVSGRNNPPSKTVEDKTVEDKRSMFNEVWSKHKKTIMIIGALGIGYFAYKKFIKK